MKIYYEIGLLRLFEISRETYQRLDPLLYRFGALPLTLHVLFWTLNKVEGNSEETALRLAACAMIAPYAIPARLLSRRSKELLGSFFIVAITLSAPIFLLLTTLLELGQENPDASIATRRAYQTIGAAAFVVLLGSSWIVSLSVFAVFALVATIVGVFAFSPDLTLLGASWIALTSVYMLLIVGVVIADNARRQDLHKQARTLQSVGTTIAHELRTPLLTIKAIGLGMERESEQHTKEWAAASNRLVKEVDAASLLIDMFLTSASQQSFAPVDHVFDVNVLVSEAVRTYPYKSKTESSAIRFEGFEASSLDVRGSDKLLQHVVFNLLKNALAHARPGTEQQIEIKLERVSENARMTFRDNGKGIPDEHIDKIFEPFYSGSSAVGTGIGLDFCRKVVEIHFQGSISCTSVPNSFTEFVIDIPSPED